MLHPTPFQFDRPLFVKIPFNAGKRNWERQEEFKWKELNFDTDKVMTLYNNGYLYHNTDLEKSTLVGDGLELLDAESLDALVNTINEKVKKHSKNTLEFDKRKCKKSKILDKQRGLIRSWRRSYGHLENL